MHLLLPFLPNSLFFLWVIINLWCKRNVGLSSVRHFTHIILMISVLTQAVCFVRRVVICAKANSSSPTSLHLCPSLCDCNLHLGHREIWSGHEAQEKYWHMRCLVIFCCPDYWLKLRPQISESWLFLFSHECQIWCQQFQEDILRLFRASVLTSCLDSMINSQKSFSRKECSNCDVYDDL